MQALNNHQATLAEIASGALATRHVHRADGDCVYAAMRELLYELTGGGEIAGW